MNPSTSFRQELVGVFGDPVAENPTQAMIEAAFAEIEIGMDWRYLTVEVKPAALGDAVKGTRAMNWKGFNCTIPHKVAVVPLLDRLNPARKTHSESLKQEAPTEMLSRLPFFCKANIRKSGGVDIPVRNRGRIWKSKETPKTNSREGLGIVLPRPVRHPAQDVLSIDACFVRTDV